MPWTTPRTWIANELVTAAIMNTHVRDNLNYLFGAGAATTYTPSWTSDGTGPTLGNGTIIGAYGQLNKLVFVRAKLTLGTTSTIGTGNYFLSLPVNTDGAQLYMGTARLIDSSAGTGYPVSAEAVTASSIRFLYHSIVASVATFGLTAATTPFTFASGDSIEFYLTYFSV